AGTPLYMAPEQLTGDPQTAASDIFGLGMLLFRCLHGRVPQDDAGDFAVLIMERLSSPVVVPPSPLQTLIASCLALEPVKRPESAQTVLDALAQHMLGLPAAPYKVGTTDVVPVGRPSAEIASTMEPLVGVREGPRPASPAGRQAGAGRVLKARAAWVAVAAVVLCLLGLAAVWFGWASAVRIALGPLAVLAALTAAQLIRRSWASRSPQAQHDAARILFRVGGHVDLTRSLNIEVDRLIERLHSLDQRIL